MSGEHLPAGVSADDLTCAWIDDARGSASVEHLGLVALLAVSLIALLAVLTAESTEDGDRSLASTLARKIRCAAQGPGPCWRDPLTGAYGRPIAGAVRALAPEPTAISGPDGQPQAQVDFRRCRRPSCAIPVPGPLGARLTTANRRTAAFTAVEDGRAGGEPVRITYWLYRPGLAWERVVRTASSARVGALAQTQLLESSNPKLIPLETLAGRNHYEFAALEEPPWRWRVNAVASG